MTVYIRVREDRELQDISKNDVMDIMSAVTREMGTRFTIDCRYDAKNPQK